MTYDEPGLKLKIPFIQQVKKYDRRLQGVILKPIEAITGDAVKNQFEKRKVLGESIGSIDYQEVYFDSNNKPFFRYMKAIPTGEVCLTCHGSNIKASLQKRINEENYSASNSGCLYYDCNSHIHII